MSNLNSLNFYIIYIIFIILYFYIIFYFILYFYIVVYLHLKYSYNWNKSDIDYTLTR